MMKNVKDKDSLLDKKQVYEIKRKLAAKLLHFLTRIAAANIKRVPELLKMRSRIAEEKMKRTARLDKPKKTKQGKEKKGKQPIEELHDLNIQLEEALREADSQQLRKP